MMNLYKLSFGHIAILVFSLLTYSQSFSECNYSGCAPTVQTPTENYINRVKCGNIDKTSYTQSTVANYTSLSTDMTVGLSYSIIVYNGNAWGTDRVSVFIDWNKDCDFNDTGETYVLNSNQGGWNFTGFISVPMSAVVGSTRMRIRMSLNSIPAPCDFSLYGEVEDYSINVITAPSINTLQLVDSQFCPGSSFQVSYEIAGTFNLGNQFAAQLSDEFGNFNNPTTIGTLNSTGNGTIECTLLDTTKASNNYYIRIVSSDPVIIGTIQGPISINSLPIAYKILGDGIYCSNNLQGALIELDSSQVNTHYQLKIDTTNVGSFVVGTGSKISFGYFTAEGSYTIEATSPDGCKNMMENMLQVKKVQPPTVFSMSSGNRIFNQLV
ncbi:GEVED domain-containing protein, partial [bacterium]|nr:GEVED domain-containing protein [bacterium]